MTIHRYAFSPLVALVPLAVLAGCGASSPPPPETPQTTSETSASSAGNAAAPPNTEIATKGSDNVALSDDQILQVTHVANMGEVEQARLAQEKAKDARVRHFAAMMIKDHTDADAKGNDVAKQSSLSPSESNTSATLKSDSESTMQQLKQSNADFDRSYMDAQVKAHRSVLDTIDNKLLPSAKNPDVRSMLQTVRAKVEGHLKEAQDIQRSISVK